MALEWFAAACSGDIAPGSAVHVDTHAGGIALIRDAEGALYAIEDRCPHAYAQLSKGLVHKDLVVCPLHGWAFALKTGQTRYPEGAGCVRSFPVRTVVDSVEIGLPVARNPAA